MSITTLMLFFAAQTLASEPGELMRKQDAVPPVFVSGVEAAPGAPLEAWLATRSDAEVKLPFTIWRGSLGEIEKAALGVVTKPPGESLRLTDSALGVSLSERLQQACGAESRCVVWLSGRFVTEVVVGSPEPARRSFAVLAFHDVVAAEGTPYAAAARAPECLAIRTTKPIHCARGPKRCADCREAEAAPARPKLLDVCPDDAGLVARPVLDIVRNGVTEHRVYDVVQVFADAAEARAFAERHGVADTDLPGATP